MTCTNVRLLFKTILNTIFSLVSFVVYTETTTVHRVPLLDPIPIYISIIFIAHIAVHNTSVNYGVYFVWSFYVLWLFVIQRYYTSRTYTVHVHH